MTSYVFWKLHVRYQFKNVRSPAHMAYSTLKIRKKKKKKNPDLWVKPEKPTDDSS